MTLSMCPSVLGKRVSISKQLWIPGGVKSGSEIQLEREPSGVLCEGTGARRGLRRALGAIRCQRDDLTPAAQVT